MKFNEIVQICLKYLNSYSSFPPNWMWLLSFVNVSALRPRRRHYHHHTPFIFFNFQNTQQQDVRGPQLLPALSPTGGVHESDTTGRLVLPHDRWQGEDPTPTAVSRWDVHLVQTTKKNGSAQNWTYLTKLVYEEVGWRHRRWFTLSWKHATLFVCLVFVHCSLLFLKAVWRVLRSKMNYLHPICHLQLFVV